MKLANPPADKADLEVMVRTAGWKLFQNWLIESEAGVVSQISMEENPDKLLRLAGALKQLQNARGWAQRTIDAVDVQLNRKKES